jgi:son of sevenless
LHKTTHHGSTPSLASWTSALSSSSANLGQPSTQTPLLPTFATQSDQLLAEPVPEFTSPDADVISSSPTLLSKATTDYTGSNQRKAGRDGALSPTFSLYRAIAEGDVSSHTFSPTPSFAASHRSQSPRLTPLLHALSLLHRAVASRRQAHYQPSTACVISCVRSLLTSTECLHRDAPTLRRVPQLAQERKIILGNLATLVSQARRCSDWPGADTDEEGAWDETVVGQAEVEQQDWELEQMLRMGGEVLRNVTQFLDVCEANNVELPVLRNVLSHGSGSGSSGSERDMQQRVRIDLGMVSPSISPHRRVQSGYTPMVLRGTGSDGAHEATVEHPPFTVRPLGKPAELSAMRTKSLNDLRERRRMQHLERSKQLHAVPMPTSTANALAYPPLRSVAQRQIQRPKQLSISSMSSLSSGSLDSYGSPISPPFPSGPCSTAQVLSALRVTHDDLLSAIAAFIGHVHSYGRHLHASSKGHLIELARETVDMVRQLLTLVEAVARHPDVGAAKAETLQEAKDALFAATNDLVEAVRETTSTTSTDVSEEDERRRTLQGATGVLKVAADCVAAVRICLSRPIGEDPFIICLPSLSSNESVPSLLGTSHIVGKRPRAVSYLRRRSMSVTSMQDHDQLALPQHVISVVTEDGESHAEDDMTIQAVDVAMRPSVDIAIHGASSGGSESTVDEESDEEDNDNQSGQSAHSFVAEVESSQECSDSPEGKGMWSCVCAIQ